MLKQYAEEKLSENAAAQAEMRTRHAHYYSDWLCCQFENLKGGEQVSALAALRAETVNLRTAWQQLLEAGEIEPIVGFLPALLLFYVINDQRLETRAVTRLLSATENVNSHRDVDVDIDVDHHHHGGYYGGCCYHVPNPWATAAAVMVTAGVIGSMVNTLPSGCQTVIINGFAYQQCGSTWYQPQMSGSSTTYVVINPPR